MLAPMPHVILVAPAAFKGTLGPRQVAEALAAGVRRAVPGASVLECPVADGGNGLLDVVLPARGAPRPAVRTSPDRRLGLGGNGLDRRRDGDHRNRVGLWAAPGPAGEPGSDRPHD